MKVRGRKIQRGIRAGLRDMQRGFVASLSDVMRDHYPTHSYIMEKAGRAASLHGLHIDVVRIALGHRVVPPPHSQRDRRIAKRIAANWRGGKAAIEMRMLDAYRKSPFFALLPRSA